VSPEGSHQSELKRSEDGATPLDGLAAHPASPDRREVLGAAGLAAIGVSVLSLPRAARAASPGGSSSSPDGVTYPTTGTVSTFDAGVLNGQVKALAVDGSQRIVLGGAFTNIGGNTINRLARVDGLTGARDTSFDPNVGGIGSSVNALGIDSDGRIVLGGSFATVGGASRTGLARVSSNGVVDNVAPTLGETPDFFGNPMAPVVEALLVAGDGSIIIGGLFGNVAGESRANVARLLANGAVATDFLVRPDGTVRALAFQTVVGVQHVLVGGEFTAVDGAQSTGRLVRLLPNGTVDTAFNANVGADGVYALAVQADGKVLLGGDFTTVGGQPRKLLARVEANGALDANFAPNIDGDAVYAIAVQGDGRIVIGGAFETVGGDAREGVARLNVDGSHDADFAVEVTNQVFAIAIAADGPIILGGLFTSVNGVDRSNLARIV